MLNKDRLPGASGRSNVVEIGSSLAEIETPAMLVDLDIMESNIRRWQADFDDAGVAFRPHIKTHKSPAIAALQIAAGATGLAVAKTAEAEVFAAAGFRDLAVAYPVIGASKWRRLAELARTCTITVNVESALGARGLSAAAVAAGSTIAVLIDVDLGLHRTGTPPENAETLARLVMDLPGLDLAGLTAYRSVGFAGAAGRDRMDVGREEGELLVALAAKLRAAGLPIRTVAAGSTPTAHGVAQVAGITEVRAGTYVFNDEMCIYRSGATMDDVALSILCTVVSGLAKSSAVDGGSKTFRATFLRAPGRSERLCQGDRGRCWIEAMIEEHGMVRLAEGVAPDVGDTCVSCLSRVSDRESERRAGHDAQWSRRGCLAVTARGKRT